MEGILEKNTQPDAYSLQKKKVCFFPKESFAFNSSTAV